MPSGPHQDLSIEHSQQMDQAWPAAHSQAHVHCPEPSCARARPWLNHNCNLRHFAVHSGEVPGALTAAPHASQMQEVDITSPGTPNAICVDINTLAAGLSQRFPAATTTETAETMAAHASTAQYVEVSALSKSCHACRTLMQVATNNAVLFTAVLLAQPAHHFLGDHLTAHAADDEARVSHLVHSMREVQERRDASQKGAHHLGIHIAQLEVDLASAKQEAAVAQEDVRSANDQYAVLSQKCDAWEQELQAILITLQRVNKRRRL